MSQQIDPLADADDLCRLTATALAQLYAKGEASPVEVTRAALARAEVVQSRFNAFVRLERHGFQRRAAEVVIPRPPAGNAACENVKCMGLACGDANAFPNRCDRDRLCHFAVLPFPRPMPSASAWKALRAWSQNWSSQIRKTASPCGSMA